RRTPVVVNLLQDLCRLLVELPHRIDTVSRDLRTRPHIAPRCWAAYSPPRLVSVLPMYYIRRQSSRSLGAAVTSPTPSTSGDPAVSDLYATALLNIRDTVKWMIAAASVVAAVLVAGLQVKDLGDFAGSPIRLAA